MKSPSRFFAKNFGRQKAAISANPIFVFHKFLITLFKTIHLSMFPISETEFFHIDSKSRLENAFLEKQWVTLYRYESKKPALDYMCNIWMWTYLVEPSVSSKALESFVEDVRWWKIQSGLTPCASLD